MKLREVSPVDAALIRERVLWVLASSWACPPEVFGTRIAIAATAKTPKIWHHAGIDPVASRFDMARYFKFETDEHFDEQGSTRAHKARWVGPVGAVVCTAVVTHCLPIATDASFDDWLKPLVHPDAGTLTLYDSLLRNGRDISDQLPFGDFTLPWAWIIDRDSIQTDGINPCPCGDRCETCWDHAGVCPLPIPRTAQGGRRLHEWTP